MNIKFYTLKFKAKDGEHTRASRRFRATIPLKGMRENDGQIEDLNKATINGYYDYMKVEEWEVK